MTEKTYIPVRPAEHDATCRRGNAPSSNYYGLDPRAVFPVSCLVVAARRRTARAREQKGKGMSYSFPVFWNFFVWTTEMYPFLINFITI